MTQVRTVIAALDSVVVQVVKKITLDIVANLTRSPSEGGTPVDTGWARSNWIPQIGSARETPAGSKENVSTSDLEQGLLDVAATYQLSNGAVYITNNVPYITALDDGWSRQAPAGFVRRAIVRAVADLT